MADSTSVGASAVPPEAEAHLRSTLATVPDAMVVIDEAGLILSFSAAAEKMFGFSESEIVGRNVKMLMPSPDRERHDQYLANYFSTGTRKIIGVGRARPLVRASTEKRSLAIAFSKNRFRGSEAEVACS